MYVDTCILAKLLVWESDSEECAHKTSGSSLVSSSLAYIEMFSLLLRKEREGEISELDREKAWREFERQIREKFIFLVPVDEGIVRRAQAVMRESHPHVPLRALDAIHLATFQSVVAGPLFTTDWRMRAAAMRLEFPLV